ncbi:nucleotide exchange factor GrpE [Nibricoccus aquaticus]|uniref:Protein GrpE n=1 Tax=Nibricoccus aquaticus TaxID=2576891 RepID=A0A290QK65_9BACT|nr:nucleotide exchange factor GrpE [Nibricoccus aquaticus]ATC64262.1 nucleotide exchange factor GrpE [Nibricoccus aquaticus]
MTASDKAEPQNETQPTPADAAAVEKEAREAGVTDAGVKAGPSTEELVAQAKKEQAEAHDRYLRLAADMENLRRRTVREKDEIRQFAAGRVLEDMISVLDNLGFGLTAAKAPNADVKTIVGGIGMVADQLKNVLGQHGLKEINPVGQTFDPNQHEAIAAQPSADVVDGNVVQVVRIGYSLNGRLLRPASVVVSSGPAKEEAK